MARSLGDGRYQVDESIGGGPHGIVYAGTDDEGNRLAFKTLREDLGRDPDLVTRYLQVAHALQGTTQPNLVRIHELIRENGTTTVVTDLVAGQNLRRRVADNDPMLPAEVARVGAGIASGLAQLHRSGIVHGDVKPENVVLGESASAKIPLVTDGVLARMLGMPHGGHGTPSLTDPRYTAPELAGGSIATPASDLYSLGIMLYEMCCGVTPFVGPTPYSVLRQHVEFEPGRPEGIPDPLWDVIWLLLLKNPQERHQNANEIAVVLSDMVGELMSAMCALRLTTPPTGRRLTGPPPGSDPGPAPGRPISDDHPTTIMAPPGGSVATGNKKRKVLTAAALSVVVLAGLIVFLSTRSGGQATASGTAPGATVAATATPQLAQPQVTAAPSSAAPTVAPNLLGDSIAQAQDLLPSVQLLTTKTIDTKHPSDTVIAQNPAAGQPLAGTMQVTIAEAPEIIYLDSLQVANGDWSQTDTNASLGGQTLVHSLISEFGFCDESDNTTTIEYDIAKGYRKLVATAGIDDQSSDSDAEVNLQIFGDNQPLSNIDVTYGKPVKLDIDVSGVLRLKLQYQPVIKGRCENDDNFDLGDAQLQGLPGEVPADVDPNSSIDSVDPGN